jgi:transposase-like protein
MSTGKHRNAGKERFWRRILGQWRRSGLSVRAFCRRHDLSEPSFYFWRRAIDERDRDAVAFVPVEVLSEPSPAPPAEPATRGLELLLANGRLLRIGTTFDGPTLRRLLALLEEGRP